MKSVLLFAASAAALTLCACTSTTKVSSVQPGDAALTCDQLKSEFAKLDTVMTEADGNKGVNTANVAAVLLFWPAAVGNYMDADKAQDLVEKRRSNPMTHYNSKGCDAPAAPAAAEAAPSGS